MEIYDRLESQENHIYGKPGGLIMADDVATRFHNEIMGKTFLITGCSPSSLGQHLAWTIAAHEPKLLILCGRSDVRLRLVAANLRHRNPGLNVRHEVFDLADLNQVRRAAERINGDQETVDVIICNAGIMLHPLRKTVDGIESHFGVNSTAHFVLVNLLLPKMVANGGGRVVTTTSGAYRYAGIRWDDPNYEVGLSEFYRVFIDMLLHGAGDICNRLTHSSAAEETGRIHSGRGLCIEQNGRHTLRGSSGPSVWFQGHRCYQRRRWRRHRGNQSCRPPH